MDKIQMDKMQLEVEYGFDKIVISALEGSEDVSITIMENYEDEEVALEAYEDDLEELNEIPGKANISMDKEALLDLIEKLQEIAAHIA